MDAAEGTSTGESSRSRRLPQYKDHDIRDVYQVSKHDEKDGNAQSIRHSHQTGGISTESIDDLLRPLLLCAEFVQKWRSPLVQLVKHYFIADKPYQDLLIFLVTLFSDAQRKSNPRERREVEIPLHLMPQLFPTNQCLEFLTGLGFEYEGVDSLKNLSQCILYVPPNLPSQSINAALTIFNSLQSFSSQEAYRLTAIVQEDANMLIALVQSMEAGNLQEQLLCNLWEKHQEFIQRLGIKQQKHARNSPSKFKHKQSEEAVNSMYSLYIVIKALHGGPVSEPQETYI